MKTKVIVYYLPQYHEVEQNNKWWGKGFTEWTNVRKGKELFAGHYQPHIPMNMNYYDLSLKETVEWQSNLAKQYNIYGFAYYHYWSEGNLILEKPVENLLNYKDIDQRFFFFWANHDWYKSNKGKKEILIKQTYGNEKDWEAHYCYWKRYFVDDRYIKIDNKPVVGIYLPHLIPNYNEMLLYLKKRAMDDGFAGIYFIESLNYLNQQVKNRHISAAVVRQPNLAFEKCIAETNKLLNLWYRVRKKLGCPKLERYNSDEISNLEIEINTSFDNKVPNLCYGVSVGWDNTVRHGKYGRVIVNSNPQDFFTKFSELYSRSCERGHEFIFINAWNEWAEGMHLEPDERFGYEYLEVISRCTNGK